MSGYDLVIRGGTVIRPGGAEVADIAIAGGRIAEIGAGLSGGAEIDATGLHIFPGVIDAHVHFNDPGRAEWEGIGTGSQAVAAGGGTLYFDMPLNSHPPVTDAASFDLKLAAAQGKSYTDFGLWGGLVPGNVEQLAELAALGVVGFKAFMSNSGIDDFSSVDDLTLYEGMQRAAELGVLVAVHAENDGMTAAAARRALAAGQVSVRDYLRSRPIIAELEAISRAILFSEETGCPLHIVHVSTGRGVDMVAAARERGLNVTCETCPHYLVLTEEDVERLGAVAKCAPPLRSAAEQAALWERLLDGSLPMVASDHSPAPASMKVGGNFFAIWGGISGAQSLLPLLLTEGHARRDLPLTAIAAATAEFVARRFAVERKGRIAPGYDADLALVDLNSSVVLSADDLLYRHRHSPFVGRTMRGEIKRTLLRGQTIFADGKIAGKPNGQLVRPTRGDW